MSGNPVSVKKEVVFNQGVNTMKLDDVGELLKGTVPLGLGSSADLLVKLDQVTSDVVVTKPDTDNFPRHYLNKFGLRVDILGSIDQDTKEYVDGYRMFDSHGAKYRDDGSSGYDTDAYDLVSPIDVSKLIDFTTPVSLLTWVHPLHRSATSFFQALTPGESILQSGSAYLNRMGFVVTINHNASSGDNKILRDTQGYIYHASCRRHEDADSMGDLIYRIINFDLFSGSTWSTEKITDIQRDSDAPEMFDPVLENKQILREDFFRAVLRARSLAEAAGIDFGFSINDGMMKTNRK